MKLSRIQCVHENGQTQVEPTTTPQFSPRASHETSYW